jgi:S1-C subfamily serine protease
LTLGEAPIKQTAAAEPPATRQKSSAPAEQPRLGLAVADLTPDLVEHLNLPRNIKGVIVGDIEDGSAASDAGVQVADIIQEVDRKPVRSIDDFRSAIGRHTGSEPILFLVTRGARTLFVAVRPR